MIYKFEFTLIFYNDGFFSDSVQLFCLRKPTSTSFGRVKLSDGPGGFRTAFGSNSTLPSLQSRTAVGIN